MSEKDHKKASRPAKVFWVTISDTRNIDTDTAGQWASQWIGQTEHAIVGYEIVPDEPAAIARLIQRVTEASGVDAVITSGGTGISHRDSTIESVEKLFDKTLVGFGELFRMLSYQAIGSAAMLSRAAAGTIGGMVVFCLPGSQAAVELGLTKLILPELGHLVGELAK